ncbi:MAG: hypothetical protein KJ583_02915 [Nanoarchaeota archaeon]|nr:hypothetical protein [Nanoarchaeota archaeon]MBU1270046.1 hypothetical protein [Nanoarchaeota archaeon]MBU1604246.1 hypothetical protein [Nanoarchaeota archaeon]MBU2443782.1 hypothetical protein [Nanoarchaeota archaeon]
MITIFSSKKVTVLTNDFVLLSKDFSLLRNNLKSAFSSVKDELDMHLDSINQSTNEIQSNYEYLMALDAKIEKLTDKVDELQMQINPDFCQPDFSDILLSKREQELFLNIYTVEDRISMSGLARKCGLTLEMCDSLLRALSSKKIPIIKQLVDGVIFVSLEYNFKDMQARKNILKIDTTISQMIN